MTTVTLAIVTCRRDRGTVLELAHSIKQHAGEFPVCVVVNDDADFVDELRSQVPAYWQVTHHSALAAWDYPLEWWSQQYFKIMMSRVIDTEWYLLLDSDNVILRAVNTSSLFRKGRAWYQRMPAHRGNHDDPWFMNRLDLAFDYMGIDHSDTDSFMNNTTPFMIHTTTMRDLSDLVLASWFDGSPDRATYEFFLYNAYLERTALMHQLYRPSANPFAGLISNRGSLPL